MIVGSHAAQRPRTLWDPHHTNLLARSPLPKRAQGRRVAQQESAKPQWHHRSGIAPREASTVYAPGRQAGFPRLDA